MMSEHGLLVRTCLGGHIHWAPLPHAVPKDIVCDQDGLTLDNSRITRMKEQDVRYPIWRPVLRTTCLCPLHQKQHTNTTHGHPNFIILNPTDVRFLAGSPPDFRTWESCLTMPPFSGFSRGSPICFPALHSSAAPYSPHFTIIAHRLLIPRVSKSHKCYINTFRCDMFGLSVGCVLWLSLTVFVSLTKSQSKLTGFFRRDPKRKKEHDDIESGAFNAINTKIQCATARKSNNEPNFELLCFCKRHTTTPPAAYVPKVTAHLNDISLLVNRRLNENEKVQTGEIGCQALGLLAKSKYNNWKKATEIFRQRSECTQEISLRGKCDSGKIDVGDIDDRSVSDTNEGNFRAIIKYRTIGDNDETPDISNVELVAICVRYVNSSCEIKEDFLQFFETNSFKRQDFQQVKYRLSCQCLQLARRYLRLLYNVPVASSRASGSYHCDVVWSSYEPCDYQLFLITMEAARTLLVTCTAVCLCAAYRLPNHVLPEKYTLDVITHLGSDGEDDYGFEGRVWIELTWRASLNACPDTATPVKGGNTLMCLAKARWPDRESIPGPPECESDLLPLRHLARWDKNKNNNVAVHRMFTYKRANSASYDERTKGSATRKQLRAKKLVQDKSVDEFTFSAEVGLKAGGKRTAAYVLHDITSSPKRAELQTWRARGENKIRLKRRKQDITEGLRHQLDLPVDQAKPGFGSTNDSNLERRLFKDTKAHSDITGAIIQNALLGQLSEEAQVARHQDLKYVPEHHTMICLVCRIMKICSIISFCLLIQLYLQYPADMLEITGTELVLSVRMF
ncbi:hypothetical protein PR048_009015 [Dryococelus australis]|uniref:Uncharacterized protein n=1 Tax=Dryococelus australis TaxID=614101 RepID=A0ABQ9HYQ4_9NEOP|nr:hypothetical protein PR048_009015 [Dryococelus australis]